MLDLKTAWRNLTDKMQDASDYIHRPRYAHGPLDNCESEFLYRRLRMARTVSRRYPGWGYCSRCGWPWSLVRGHDTWYEPHRALFCLCHDCWHELETPEHRMPYYRAIWEKWHSEKENWAIVEAAVQAEREVIDRQILTEINVGWPLPRPQTNTDSHG